MERLSGAVPGMTDDPLEAARRGLERGDYGQVLRLLEPLAALHPARTALGGEVRLLMTTALMGQGQSERAQACCRELLCCSDPLLRTQARDLLLVLEAPALSRPRDWSLTLPALGDAPSLEGSRAAALRRRANSGPPPPPPPPVGATRAPIGFAALVIALVLLALGLGGCMQVRSDLHFEGPGRLRLEHHLRSDSGRITPWQRQFALALEAEGFRHDRSGGEEQLIGSVQPAAAALAQLAGNLELASQLGGVPPAAAPAGAAGAQLGPGGAAGAATGAGSAQSRRRSRPGSGPEPRSGAARGGAPGHPGGHPVLAATRRAALAPAGRGRQQAGAALLALEPARLGRRHDSAAAAAGLPAAVAAATGGLRLAGAAGLIDPRNQRALRG